MTPSEGELAFIRGYSPAAAVVVVETDHAPERAVALLLADVSEERREMLLEGDERERAALTKILRKNHAGSELFIPYDHFHRGGTARVDADDSGRVDA